MIKLLIAYLAGMLASIPAYLMFNQVGASPFRNLDAVSQSQWGALSSILIYFALIFIVPPFGSTIGAKIAGGSSNFRYCFQRGIGGQFVFSIGLSLLITFVASVGAAMDGLGTGIQTIVFLMAAQVGCTLGTVWGFNREATALKVNEIHLAELKRIKATQPLTTPGEIDDRPLSWLRECYQ